jgi:hypothetical protein
MGNVNTDKISDLESKIGDLEPKINFVYRESENYLRETIKSSRYIRNKIMVWLLFNFVVNVACLSMIAYYVENNFINAVLNVALVANMLLSFLQYLFCGKKMHAVGNEPKNLLTSENMSQSIEFMKLGEIESYQTRINYNCAVNERLTRVWRCYIFSSLVSYLTIVIVLVSSNIGI